MSNRPSLDDYIDVAERIVAFKEKHPEGSLQTIDWQVVEVAGKTFVVYRAAAFRTADDPRPGHGTAWEPFPGPTPYTKDSELMNAETAAWGRAIVAVGIAANRKIASKQEVKAREANHDGTAVSTERAQPVAQPAQTTERVASAKQRGLLNVRASEANLAPSDFADAILRAAGQQAREFDSQEHAQQFVNRTLDRLPARLVDAVLAELQAAGAPA